MFQCLFLVVSPPGHPSHTAAVVAAIVLLLLLGVAALVYSRCHLNIKLWYRNSYGDYELNGKTWLNYSRVQGIFLLPPPGSTGLSLRTSPYIDEEDH